MKTVRQRILEYVQNKGVITAQEVSQALGMTQANARHHLGILLDEGAVEVAGQLPQRGRGRPALLYSSTRLIQQHNLDRLASAMLQEFIANLPAEAKSQALGRVARRLQDEEMDPHSSLTQRLNQTVQHLNRSNYQSRWEAHAEAPHLILGHCPYAAILPEHPELCLLDAMQLEGLLQAPVQQTAKRARDSRGVGYCRFIVGKKV